MGKRFDGIDIFFIIVISLYFVTLIIFIFTFFDYYQIKNHKLVSKNITPKKKKSKNKKKKSKKVIVTNKV